MHLPSLLALLLATTPITSGAPTSTPLNLSPNFSTATRDLTNSAACPSSGKSCGVVTFKGGQYTSFGQGVCMKLGNNVESIYVAKCYCSLWSTCSGSSGKDVYVDGMMMCEKPRMMEEFGEEVRYISCGGMH